MEWPVSFTSRLSYIPENLSVSTLMVSVGENFFFFFVNELQNKKIECKYSLHTFYNSLLLLLKLQHKKYVQGYLLHSAVFILIRSPKVVWCETKSFSIKYAVKKLQMHQSFDDTTSHWLNLALLSQAFWMGQTKSSLSLASYNPWAEPW